MVKNLRIKNILLLLSATFIFNACSSKSEQEYNKPALYWYNKMMMQIGMGDLDEADDTYTSLESEHRNSPYIPTAMLILVNAHMQDEEYALANFYLDEYIKRFSLSKDIDYARYMKIKANFMGFKQQFRDQQLIDDTLAQILEFKNKYKNSPYMPLVDTMNARLFMAKASMDKEISELYQRRDKPMASEYYMQKSQDSWVNPEEINKVEVPFYRAIFE
ncbi:outer membrane protein assembly factor BamD [Aliarcobacter vitoriensis]|uniref:Outer membrane protein assembly factor BamD n=1 Tax=Aliarcobacter vitoriensis TaxID=2011099 RepID=A0A366MU29_9BACT|nr:outer membrane protein assembly factor BamD [Aliarcobacter vitoriensis]RBQ29567.1 outer membrane protein assembly factor BamD [Aliarcobacter vitoriensis]RBQ32209.1 outer membrane protein assembly factor BamD [Arcobacter sp. FW59]